MKLSIIVPVYNLENYISLTLDSLLSIRLSDSYEILVINDGSKDRSEEIIRSYQQKHSQIKLYTIENQGVSNARNFGISKARGEYITFVDGDDTVDPDFFAKAVRALDEGSYDFVQGNYLVVDSKGMHRQQYVDKDTVLSAHSEMLKYFIGPNKRIHNAVWGKVFRAKVVQKISFDTKLKVSEDQKYIFDVLSISNSIMLMSANCINYIQRESSAVHGYNTEKEMNKLFVLNYMKAGISQPEILANLEKQKIQVLLGLYYHYTKEKNSLADEVRHEIMTSDYQEAFRLIDGKNRIILFALRYVRCALDFYIRNR